MHGTIWDFVGAGVYTPLALTCWLALLFGKMTTQDANDGFAAFFLAITLISSALAAYCIGRLVGLSA